MNIIVLFDQCLNKLYLHEQKTSLKIRSDKINDMMDNKNEELVYINSEYSKHNKFTINI